MLPLADAIPVTTIGGYLGAGKTTLLNDVLSGDHGLRIAVLVNDFGAISIDAKLVTERDGDVVSLANGCACCSVAGDLAAALDRVARAAPSPEHILVEASGVANPARISVLANSPGLRPGGTIVLADAETLIVRASDKFVGRLVRDQLASGDLIVLNKIDLVDGRRLEAIRAWLSRVVTGALVVETVQGRLPSELLLGLTDGAKGAGPFFCEDTDQPVSLIFESHVWASAAPVDQDALRAAIAALPATVVRVKGLVAPRAPADKPVVLHRVGRRLNVEPLRRACEVERTEIVVIANAGTLDRTALDATLNRCVVQRNTKGHIV